MPNSSPIAKRLKEARTEAGFSQKSLGIAAGIDEFSASARINQYERGKHTPDYETVEKLARVLSFPVPYFYATDDEMAEMIVEFGKLSSKKRREVIALLRKCDA